MQTQSRWIQGMKYGKQMLAWLMLVVMGINCFGGQVCPVVARVQASEYEASDYEKASEEAEATIRAAEEAVGIGVDDAQTFVDEESFGSQANGEETETSSEAKQEEATEEKEDTEVVYESMTISNTMTLSEDMEVGDLTVNNPLHLNGYKMTVHGNVIVNSELYIEEGKMTVHGNWQEKNESRIYMTSYNDYVEINGDYVSANSYYYSNEREKGIWEVKGNFYGPKENISGGRNKFSSGVKVLLSGTEKQILDVPLDSNMFIHTLVISNTSEDGVLSNHMLLIDSVTDTNDQIHYIYEGNKGVTLEEDTIIDGDYYLTSGTLNLNGYEMYIKGSLIHAGGDIVVNGGKLTIEGDYKQQYIYEKDNEEIIDYSVGRLIMTNEADYVLIKGNYVNCGKQETEENLTDGILELQGSMLTHADYVHTMFRSGVGHTVKLTGAGEQLIQVSTQVIEDYVCVGNLIIEQPESGSVVLEAPIVVMTTISHNSPNISGTTQLVGAVINSANLYGDIELGGECFFLNDITIHGNLTSFEYDNKGLLSVEGCHVTVRGDYTSVDCDIQGTGSNSVLTVEGNLHFNCEEERFITNMTLEVGGNVTHQNYGPIKGEETATIHFIGMTEQVINISSYASYFTNVVIDNPAGVIVKYTFMITNVIYEQGMLTYESGGIHGYTLEEDVVHEGDLMIGGGVLKLNGHQLHVTGDLTMLGGKIEMTDARDYLLVDGDLHIADTANNCGILTDGILELRGDYLQEGAWDFTAEQNHTTIFSGTEKQTVSEENYFQNVILNNQQGVVAEDMLTVQGVITQNGPFEGLLGLTSTTKLNECKYDGDATVARGILYMKEDWTLNGSLIMKYGNYIYMQGHNFHIKGDLQFLYASNIYVGGGHLQCGSLSEISRGGVCFNDHNSLLTVEDNAHLAFSSRYNIKYSGSKIIIGENLSFDNESNLVEQATIELNGTVKQTVTMDQTMHSINKLVITNTSDDGIYVAKDLKCNSIDNQSGARISFSDGGIMGYTLQEDTIIEEDLVLAVGVLDLNGYHLTVNGNLQQLEGNILLKGGTLTVKGNYEQRKNVSFGTGNVVLEGDWICEKNAYGSSTNISLYGDILDDVSTTNIGCVVLNDKSSLTVYQKEQKTQVQVNVTTTDFQLENTNGIDLAEGHTIKVNGNTLTNGYGIENGMLSCYGTIADSSINANVYLASTVVLDKDLCVTGDLQYAGAELNGCHLSVMQNCELLGSQIQDDGSIEIKGNVTCTSYNGSEANQIILSGDRKQIISSKGLEWEINELVIHNTSEEGVYAEGYLNVKKVTDPNHKLALPENAIVGYTLTKDTTIQGDVVLMGGTLDLNGYTLRVLGNVIHRNGSIVINEGELLVEGNYTMGNQNAESEYEDSNAYIQMDKESDYVCVSGNVTLATPIQLDEYMIKGVFELKGNFSYRNIDSKDEYFSQEMYFCFSGRERQIIDIVVGRNYNYFYFGTLDIQNTSVGGVYAETLRISNPIIGVDNLNGKYLYWESLKSMPFSQWDGDVYIQENLQLLGDITIGGTLYVNQKLDVNGKHLVTNNLKVDKTLTLNGGIIQVNNDVIGSYYDSSQICMENEMDVIQVAGDFKTYCGTLNLMAGQLDVKGNLFIGEDTKVLVGDTHTTTLSGKIATNGTAYIQEVTIPEDIVLNKLVLTKPREYYVFNRDVEGMCKELVDDLQDIVAPSVPIGLSATQVSYTKATISWQESTDDTNVSGYDLYRDDKKIMSLSGTSYTDKELTPGTQYKYYVIAKDATFNTSAASSMLTVNTLEDTEAPTVPDNLALTERTATTLKFIWNASTDNVKTVGYHIYRDGEKIASTSNTEYLDTHLDTNASYTYQITSYDETGNESECSEEISFYTQVVEISKMSPENYSMLSGGVTDFEVVFKNAGSVNGYQVYMAYKEEGQSDYKEILSKTIGKNTAYRKELSVIASLDTKELASEEIELLLRITDAGGYILEETKTYYLDKTAPSKITEVGAEVKDGVVVISYAKGAEVDIAGYYIYRKQDGQELKEIANITEAGKTYYYDKSIEDGVAYTYYVAAYDKEGYVGEKSDAVAVVGTADISAPVIESVGPVEDILHGEYPITIKARDNKALEKATIEVYNEETEQYTLLSECFFVNGVAQYLLDTTAYAEEVSLQITVYDTSGNENAEEYIKVYPVDNQGPEQITDLTAEVLSTTVVLSWNAPTEDDFSYFLLEEQLEDGSFVEIGRTTTVTGYLLEGLVPQSNHSYRVTGYDVRGNKGVSSELLVVTVADDTIAPRIMNISPNGGYFNGTIPLRVNAYDNREVASVIIESSTDKESWSEVQKVTLEKPVKNYTLYYDFSLEEYAEGDMYIRTYAIDTAGNIGDVNQVLVQYVVDQSAPSRVDNLRVEGTEGRIHLSWNEPIENDVAKYQIFRSPEGLNAYACIADNVTTLDYYDRAIAYNSTYTYKIRAVDYAGNMSEYSNIVIAQKMFDSEKPRIHSLLPEQDAWISDSYEMSAYVTDNDQIASVEFAIKESEDNATKVIVDTVPTSINAGTVTSVLDTTAYANGVYDIIVTAKDVNGNVSEVFVSQCHICNVDLPIPNLYVNAGNWCVNLSYSSGEENTYVLYKKKLSDDVYSVAASGTGSLLYKDLDVHPNYTYVYQLEVRDKAGNVAKSIIHEAKPGSVDDIVPKAVVLADTSVVAGYQMVFNGLQSTDNDKIASYQWDFGDGSKIKNGPTPVHSYKKAGDYYVTLTVKDKSGNTADARMKITVLPKSASGKAVVTVQNANGTPLQGVSVYVNTSAEKNDVSYTDSKGVANIMQKPGTYRVALYKDGYVATEVSVEVELHGEKEYVFTLAEGETMTADFTVRQLTYEEIIAAGIDITDPQNQHVFTAKTSLTFEPAKEEEEEEEVFLYPLKSIVHSDAGSGSGESSGGNGNGGNNNHYTPPASNVEAEEVANKDLYYTIHITSNISWLKDMYQATLIVYNNANSQTIVAKDLSATIRLPEGISLVSANSGESPTLPIEDIRGGESKKVSWYLRGDVPGIYKLMARISGTLQPFNAHITSDFESTEFEVTAGQGLVLTIRPEQTAYKDNLCYVYLTLANEGSKDFINVKAKFSLEGGSGAFFTASPDGSKVMPILTPEGVLAVERLRPGEQVSGYYKVLVPLTDETYDYMELIKWQTEVLKGANLGVEIRVEPVPSRLIDMQFQEPTDENSEGDPVNVSTGAYTDAIPALSVQGVNPISADLQYDSTATESAGDFGYGWTHNYEVRMETQTDGMVRYYVSPTGFYTFMPEDFEKVEYQLDANNQWYLDTSVIPVKQNFNCMNDNKPGYQLERNSDATFTLTDKAGTVMQFDKEGKLTSITGKDNKQITITRTDKTFTVTDVVSKRKLIYTYNDEGFVDKIEDHTGRVVNFYYDEYGNLKQFTNAIGENTYYAADEEHRILEVNDDKGNVVVANTYEKDGNRVVEQLDGLENKTLFSYAIDELTGNTITTVTTPSEQTKKTETDIFGNIVRMTNEAGDVTEMTYDLDGNELSVNNANGYSVIYDYDSDGNMTRVTNSLNEEGDHEVVMTYDDSGNMLTMQNCNGESMRSTYYEDTGLIKSVTDQNNNTIHYDYNSYGKLLKETDARKEAIEYNYYTNGDLFYVKDKNDNYTVYTYNDLGLVETTTIQKEKPDKDFDVANASGTTTTTYYDDLGRVDYSIDAMGGVTSYEYDHIGNLTSRTDPAGAVTVFQYNKNYQLVKEIVYASEGDIGAKETSRKVTSITDYTYTKDGLLKTIRDGKSETVITNSYDVVGNKTKEVEKNKDGKKLSEIHYEYDKAGNVTKETQMNVNQKDGEPESQSVEYQYYPNGKLQSVTDVTGEKTIYTYDKSWRVQMVTSGTKEVLASGRGLTTTYTYDPAGRIMSETVEGADGSAQSVSYTYDIYGNVVTATDSKNNVTTYRYDGNGNLTETEDATNRVFYNTYDENNRVVSTGVRVKDENGAVTKDVPLTTMDYEVSSDSIHTVTQNDVVNGGKLVTYYDSAGRAYKTMNGENQVLSETFYDTEGRILQTVDSKGLLTEYVYNDFLQVAKVRTGKKGLVTSNGYAFVDEDIRETSYSYDDFGRNTKVSEKLVTLQADGTMSNDTTVTSVVYDGFGRLQSMKDPNQNAAGGKKNTYEYIYNSKGLLEQETNSLGNTTKYQYNAKLLLESMTDAANQTTSYEYDSLNRIKKVKDQIGTIEYIYDENGNIKQVKETENALTDLLGIEKNTYREYDELNRIKKYTDYKGREIGYQYDSLGNLKALTYPGGEVVTYQYNVAGLMTSMTLTSNTGGTLYTWGYTYDNYGRLHTITRPDGTTEERSYDLAGNLVHQVEKDKAGTIIQENDYTYNVFGEIIQKTTSQSGNPAKMTAVSMNYNSANRLTKWDNKTVRYDDVGNMVEGPVKGDMQTLTYDCRNRLTQAGDITYDYDAENNRISTIENGLTTEYVYDTSGSLSQLLVAYEPDNTTTIYIYGAEGLAGQYNTGTKKSLFYHFDNIGSTTMLTDLTGKVIERIAYGTYGELLTDVKTVVRFLYNGAYGVMTDSNGLYYMRARYYNPDIKRFINQDVKVGDISNSQSLNRYAYCEGNPVSLVDPFGLCGQDPNEINWWSLGAHFLLGIGGMAPGIGFAFDLADAALCYYEKDYLGMSLAFASAAPAVGLAVGAGKLGKRALTIGGYVVDMIKNSNRIRHAADMIATATSNARKLMHSGVTDVITAIVSKGDDAAKLLRKGGEGFEEVSGMIRHQGEEIYTTIEKSVKRLTDMSDTRRDLTDYLGIEIEDIDGAFYSLRNKSGGKVYVSMTEINSYDFDQIVKRTGGKINILSGVHGDTYGNIEKSLALYNIDVEDYASEVVKVFDFSEMDYKEISRILNSKDTTICAWCYSDKNPAIRLALMLGELKE